MKVKVPIHRTSPTQSVLIDPAATVGAQIGVNLLLPDGTLAKMSDFGVAPASGDGTLTTTDDLDEGQWNLWFTDLRAQDAVGGILVDTATIDFTYTAGASITADLKDLADSGVGAALVKITRDAKGRISGTSAATTTDLTEGTNLYFTDARADARITVAKADPNGIASLVGGKLDAGQLPALAITETFVVNTEAAMLALSAQEGDVAVRTDLSKSFILTASPASTLANWQELLTPASPVTSVFGRVGSVTAETGDYTFAQIGSTPTTLAGYGITDAEPTITAGTTTQYRRGDKTWQTLNKGSVGLGNVDNTSDANKPVSTAQQSAMNALSFKNRLINGDFAINQRSFAGGALVAGVYGFDRWKAGTGGCNVSLSGGVLTHTSGPLVQAIESPSLASQTVTVSVEDPSGSLTVNVDGVSGTITAGAGRRGVAIAVPSGSTGNVTLTLTGTGITYKRVQLELGSVATAFDWRPAAIEMALCQRYFELSYPAGYAPGSVVGDGKNSFAVGGTSTAANLVQNQVGFQVKKRVNPAMTIYSPTTGTAGYIHDNNSGLDIAGTATSAGPVGFIWYGTTTGGAAGINCSVHWAASAEL